MDITYEWKIENLQTFFNENNLQVVFMACWKVTGTNGTQSSAIYGMQTIKFDETKPFVPYENLTEQLVIDWVKENMGEKVEQCEKDIVSQIKNQLNPLPNQNKLPWE